VRRRARRHVCNGRGSGEAHHGKNPDCGPTLLTMPGCGALTAAKITGECALVTRFPSEVALARYCGLVPIPHWSGSTAGRMRGARVGNRALNAAIHRIAVTQLRLTVRAGPLRQAGSSARHFDDGVRCLNRRLVPVVFGHLYRDLQLRNSPTQAHSPVAGRACASARCMSSTLTSGSRDPRGRVTRGPLRAVRPRRACGRAHSCRPR